MPAGLHPLTANGSSVRKKKLGLLNLCAVCEALPADSALLIALVAYDDPDTEVRQPVVSKISERDCSI